MPVLKGDDGGQPSGLEPDGGHGVWGDSAEGDGVVGTSAAGAGVVGKTLGGSGVVGDAAGESTGVVGGSEAGVGVSGRSDTGPGVQGQCVQGSEAGVLGRGTDGPGVRGESNLAPGVMGETSATGVGGVEGLHSGNNGPGVYGRSSSGPGVEGETGSASSPGVMGSGNPGVEGRAGLPDVCGVRGQHNGGGGIGVGGYASGWAGVGVYGSAPPDRGYAAKFNGSVDIVGHLTKTSGGFKIDHPLEPESKYLSHSFVESPEMKNVYDGVALLDEGGSAWVELPGWFEALNKDCRYQLTPIGEPAPGLHVAEELSGNRFKIAGGGVGMRVSWQLTGVRHDRWAEENPIRVEEEKAAEERDLYLHPKAHAQPEELEIVPTRKLGLW